MITIPIDNYRNHIAGRHQNCDVTKCPDRRELSSKARERLYARLILDYLRDRNISWEKLGKDLAPMRKAARWNMSKYPWLAEEFKPGFTERLEAKYWAQDIIAGRTEYFPVTTSANDPEDPDNMDYWGA